MISRRHFLQTALALAALTACGGGRKQAKLPERATVLALGDSLTAGVGANPGEDYPARLAAITGWQVVNGGVSGNTSAQALARLPELMRHQPDLVIISIGGNDFLKKQPEAETRANIATIIKTVQAADVPAVLVAVPYVSAAALLGKPNEHPLYRELAAEFKLPLFEGTWADILGDNSLKSDPIHANAAGYRHFAEELAKFLQKQGFY